MRGTSWLFLFLLGFSLFASLFILAAPGAGAISVRAAVGAANGGATTLEFASPPSGTAQYDLMLAVVTVRGGTGTTITPATGWTLVSGLSHNTLLNDIKQEVFYKVAGASEAGPYSFGFSSSQKASGGIVSIQGADSSAAIDVSGGQANDVASTSATAPSVDPTVSDTILVGFFGLGRASDFPTTPEDGMAEQTDIASTGGGPTGRTTTSIATEARSADTATDTKVRISTDSSVSIGQVVIVKMPTVAFSASTSSGSESTTSVTIPVTLSAAASATVTVNYADAGTGSATGGGVDYTLTSGTLTFNAGETSKNIPITVVDDGATEGAETIVIILSGPSNARLGSTTSHTYTINDDDVTPNVTLSILGTPMAEAGGTAAVTATLSATSSSTVTVNLDFTGTATVTSDYTRSATSISISPGGTSGSITLTAVQDAIDEPAETVIVDILSVTNGNEASPQQVTASITDDDLPEITVTASDDAATEAVGNAGEFTISRTTGDVSGSLTVLYSVSGTATPTSDYTALTGSAVILATQSSVTVAVAPIEDATSEPDETVIITLTSDAAYTIGSPSSATVTIVDNDLPIVTVTASDDTAAEPGSNTGTFTFSRSGATTSSLTVLYAITGTATPGTGNDYTTLSGSVTIGSGSSSQTVTVTALDDSIDEADETVIVTITSDAAYSIGSPGSATVTIQDDDATPTVTLAVSGSPMAEAGGAATVTATLSAVSGLAVTVNLDFTGSTATLTSDYTRTGTSIVIAAGGLSNTITLTAVQDAIDEADETILVAIDSVTNGLESGTQSITATITDDDATPTVTLAVAGSPIAEAAGTATVTATLSAASGLAVTVNLDFTGSTATLTDDYTRSGTFIVISAGSLSGTITLTAVQDALDEADETIIVAIDSVTNGIESGTQSVTATITDDDATPTVTLAVSGSPMAEAAGTATVTATLSAVSGLAVTVNLDFTGGTATLTSDYTRTGTSIVIAAGSPSNTITLTAVQDAVDESAETIIVSIDSVTNGVESGTQSITATITDDDPPEVTITANDPSAAEASSSTGQFTISRTTGDTSGALTVLYAVSGTATNGVDYTALTGTAVILATASSVTITITPVDDSTSEADETVIITLSADAAYTIGSPSSDAVTIADNDPPLVTVVATDSTASEPGSDTGTFTFSRTGTTTSSLTVLYSISGTATPGSGNDYTTLSGSVTIGSGSSSQTVTVTALDDSIDEADETVIVTVSADAAYTVGSPSTATVTIQDDEATPTVTLAVSGSPMAEAGGVATITATLSAVSGLAVTVNLDFTGGTATLTDDYTRSGTSILISPGGLSSTITLTAVQDVIDEADETIIVSVDSVTNGLESGTQSVTATITDDDATPTVTLAVSGSPMAEAGGEATVTATLSAVSGLAVTVNLDFTGSTATLTSDYTRTGTSIVIAAGSLSNTITLTAVQDAIDEANETIIVSIDSVTNGLESGTQSITATITDDDATPTVTLAVSGSPMAEAGGVATVTATLSAVSGLAVTVGLDFTGGTATLTDDYTRSGTSIVISAGSPSGTITLTAVQDALDEANETIIVSIDSVTNGLESGTQSITATITDDDATPTVTLSVSGSPMAEAGGAATVTATLSAVSGLAVTVNLDFTGGTATLTDDYTRSGTSIVIAAGSASSSITLTAVQDALDEADETIIVAIDAVTNGLESGTQSITATITDDDATPTVTLAISGTPMAEAGGVATVTATLSAVSGLPVTVNLDFAGTATLTTDFTRSGTSISISAGGQSATLTLTAVQDALDENDETIVVDISSATNAVEAVAQQVTATITDDDATPTVTLAVSGSPMAEASGVATVTATLSAASGLPVTVNLDFAGTATLTTDFTRSGSSISIAAGATSGSITLTAVQDASDEPDETIIVDVGSVANALESVAQQVTATITDDDSAPSVTLALSGSPMAEAGGVATISASLNVASGFDITIALAFDGNATLTSDFTRSGTSISILAGATSGSITLTAVQDTTDEWDESIIVDIDSVTNAVEVVAQQVTATITDDDAAPNVTLSAAASSIAEAAGSTTITATLGAASGKAIVVNLEFTGTATFSTDYTRSGVSIAIAAGATSGSVTLTAVQDALPDGNESVVVDISTLVNAIEAAPQQVIITIVDDDAAPNVSLTLTGGTMAEAGGVATVTATLSLTTGLDVTVNLAFAGTATLTDDFTRSGASITIAAGGTAGSITLTAVQDALDEDDETIIVSIDSVLNGNELNSQQVTATITDDDATPSVTLSVSGSPMAEAGGTATLTATLSAVSGLPVTVGLSFDGTATLTSDYTRSGTSISISAGAQTGSITLTAVQDTVDEAGETIIVDVSSVTNVLESTAQQITATITDDDAPTITISAPDASASETGASTATFRFTRTAGDTSATLTVNYTVSGTATSGSDYAALAGQAIILATQTSVDVVVTPIDDLTIEAAETIIITLTASGSYIVGSPDSVNITLADDDGIAVNIVQSGGSTLVNESITEDTFTVVLGAAPASNVVISITSGDVGEASVSPATLTFTTSNWDTAQTVTVQGVDDIVIDGAQSVTITISVVDADSSDEYDAVANQTVTVTVSDNDVANAITWRAPPVVIPANVSVPFVVPDVAASAALSQINIRSLNGSATAAQVRSQVLETLPVGIPAPTIATPTAQMWDLDFTTANGTDVAFTEAVIRFFVADSWLQANCPTSTCGLRLLHWTGAAWDEHTPTVASTNATGSFYEASAASFSPFMVAGVSIGGGGGGGGGGGAPVPPPAAPPVVEVPPIEPPTFPGPEILPPPDILIPPGLAPVVEDRPGLAWTFVIGAALTATVGAGLAYRAGAHRPALRLARHLGRRAREGATASSAVVAQAWVAARDRLSLMRPIPKIPAPRLRLADPLQTRIQHDAHELDRLFHTLNRARLRHEPLPLELRERALADAKSFNHLLAELHASRRHVAHRVGLVPDKATHALAYVGTYGDVERTIVAEALRINRHLAEIHRARGHGRRDDPVARREILQGVELLNELFQGVHAIRKERRQGMALGSHGTSVRQWSEVERQIMGQALGVTRMMVAVHEARRSGRPGDPAVQQDILHGAAALNELFRGRHLLESGAPALPSELRRGAEVSGGTEAVPPQEEVIVLDLGRRKKSPILSHLGEPSMPFEARPSQSPDVVRGPPPPDGRLKKKRELHLVGLRGRKVRGRPTTIPTPERPPSLSAPPSAKKLKAAPPPKLTPLASQRGLPPDTGSKPTAPSSIAMPGSLTPHAPEPTPMKRRPSKPEAPVEPLPRMFGNALRKVRTWPRAFRPPSRRPGASPAPTPRPTSASPALKPKPRAPKPSKSPARSKSSTMAAVARPSPLRKTPQRPERLAASTRSRPAPAKSALDTLRPPPPGARPPRQASKSSSRRLKIGVNASDAPPPITKVAAASARPLSFQQRPHVISRAPKPGSRPKAAASIASPPLATGRPLAPRQAKAMPKPRRIPAPRPRPKESDGLASGNDYGRTVAVDLVNQWSGIEIRTLRGHGRQAPLKLGKGPPPPSKAQAAAREPRPQRAVAAQSIAGKRGKDETVPTRKPSSPPQVPVAAAKPSVAERAARPADYGRAVAADLADQWSGVEIRSLRGHGKVAAVRPHPPPEKTKRGRAAKAHRKEEVK